MIEVLTKEEKEIIIQLCKEVVFKKDGLPYPEVLQAASILITLDANEHHNEHMEGDGSMKNVLGKYVSYFMKVMHPNVPVDELLADPPQPQELPSILLCQVCETNRASIFDMDGNKVMCLSCVEAAGGKEAAEEVKP